MTNQQTSAMAEAPNTAVQARLGLLAAISSVALAAVLAAAEPGAAETESGAAEGKIIVSHGYSNFGELKYPADFTHLDYVNPDAPKGGEISIWAQGNFDSFNQYASDGVPASLNTIGSEAVLTSTADDPYGIYCFMCTTLEYPEDLSFVTFNLRDDVTFSDGSPMTADDVAFSFNLFQTQGIVEYRRVVERYIDRVEVEDPYRITFYFTDEAPLRDRIGFAGGTPVFSMSWFDITGARLDQSTDTPFMSTGAYVLESYEYNRQVIYVRNPDYWAKDLPFAAGRDNFDRIRVEYFADGTAALEGFKAGAYTFRAEVDPLSWAKAYDFPAIKEGVVVRDEITDGNVGARFSWVFNLDKEKWQDRRVRQAIAMMFNFEWSNQTLFYGYYKQPVSYWSGTDLAATGVPDDSERDLLEPLVDQGLLDAGILTAPAAVPVPHSSSRSRPSRMAFRAAGKLLDEAGWWVNGERGDAIGAQDSGEDDSWWKSAGEFLDVPAGGASSHDDGIRRNSDGERLALTIIQFNPLYDNMINPFIENLKSLGIDAELERMDTAQYVQRRREGDFDLSNQIFDMRFEPSSGLKQWYGSETADSSSRNLMRLRNPGIDRLIDKVVDAQTLDELRTSVKALDRALRAVAFDIPLRYKPESWVAYYNYIRHPENLPPLAVGHLDFWWADQDAFEKLKAEGAI